MNSTAVVLKLTLPFSSSCYHAAVSSSSNELRTSSKSVAVAPSRPTIEILSSEFRDQGHLQYYKPKNHGSSSSAAGAGLMTIRSGKQEKAAEHRFPKKMKKKQMKLLKGLTRDLSTFSRMGFGLDSDSALVDQVKGNMISEAAELLLERLQKIRADEKELKRKTKEEKATLKASRMQTTGIDCEVYSGSSLKSCNSECGEVLDMKKDLKPTQAKQNDLQEAMVEATLPALPGTSVPEERMNLQLKSSCNTKNKCGSGAVIACARTDLSSLPNPSCSKKIEVCMGGKCRKSGAAALLEEFQEAVGIEGAVSGCKCMGKCRDGPNVKVLNGFGVEVDDNSLGTSPCSSLCIGVGFEDVKLIVASLIGQDHNQRSFAAAS